MSATSVQIKVAEPTDAASIMALLKAISHESTMVIVDPHLPLLTVAQERRQIRLINQTRNNVIIVAKRQRISVGIVTVQQVNNTDGELGIAVRRSLWHRGLGTYLLKEAIRWFRGFSSLKRLVLTVKKQNRIALRLYVHSGFKVNPHLDRVQDHSVVQMELR